MKEVIEDVVVAKRLRWEGHVAHMDDCHLPKRLLFGWLPQRRPAHGTKQRWRDKVRKDLKQFGIEESSLSHNAQDRLYWRACVKRSSLHALRRDRVREVHMAVVLMLLQTPQHLLHLCVCASLVPGHSEGARHCKTQVPDNSATHFSCDSGKCCLISVCHFVAEKHHLYQVAFFQVQVCVS